MRPCTPARSVNFGERSNGVILLRMELAKFQRPTNLRFCKAGGFRGSQAILRYFKFSLPALNFLTLLPLSDSLGLNRGRFCAEHLWAHADFLPGRFILVKILTTRSTISGLCGS